MSVTTKKFFDKTFFIIVISNVLLFYLFHFSDVPLSWEGMLNSLDYMFVESNLYYIFQFFAPLYAGLAAIFFFTVRKNSFAFQAGREGSYANLITKNIVRQSLRISLACYVSFLIIFTIACIFGSTRMDMTMELRKELGKSAYDSGVGLFLDIFGENFYFDNYVLHDFLVHTVQYFYAPFLYAILGAYFSLLFEKKYQVFLITVLYYYSLTLFFNRVGMSGIVPEKVGRVFNYFEPARLSMPNSIHAVSTPLFFLASLIPPLIPSVIILYRQIRKVKDRI